MKLDEVLKKVGLVFDSDSDIYVHRDMRIPITVYFDEKREEVVLLDQTKLPYEVVTWRSKDWKEIADSGIRSMIVRGSQAIGCVAGYATLLAAISLKRCEGKEFLSQLEEAGTVIKNARPTAYPLMWAVDLVVETARKAVREGEKTGEVLQRMKEAADYFLATDLALGWFLRQEGMKHIRDGDVIMTHCNGGSLSSSFGGHALGMIEEAYSKGVDLIVVSKETRPRCQGYKLTVWELNRAGVPVVIVTDNMIFSSFKRYGVSKVILGVDRVARDGAVINKIGSADLSVIARRQGIPFYYATSYSTMDLKSPVGDDVPIEERDVNEITYFYRLDRKDLRDRGLISDRALSEWPPLSIISKGKVPKKGEVGLYNPAFDVTPPDAVTAIITDIGTFKPSEVKSLTGGEINRRVAQRLAEWGLKPPISP